MYFLLKNIAFHMGFMSFNTAIITENPPYVTNSMLGECRNYQPTAPVLPG
jgi:hypothetical protein